MKTLNYDRQSTVASPPEDGRCHYPPHNDRDTESFSPFARALASFVALIWRYTGEADITIEVVLGRTLSKSAESGTVVLGIGDNTTADILLRRATDAYLTASLRARNGDLRNRSMTFVWRNAASRDGAAFEGFSLKTDVARGRLVATRLSNHGALSAATPPALMNGHFQTLLAGMQSNPSTQIGDLPLLSEAEKQTIIGEWSCPTFDESLKRDELLHEIFEQQADLQKDKTALEFAGERLSYAQVDKRANQLARHLRAIGAGPGRFVAILLPRSNEVFVSMLAALKAGAAYIPLDPEYPTDRISYILRDCGVHTLITTSALAGKHSFTSTELLHVDRDWGEVSLQPDARLSREETGAKPDDVCYVIYTSGSTGRPKGVQIEHRSACHLVRAEGWVYGVRPDDRVYQGFSVAFDASVEEIWLAFFSGATLVVGTPEMAHSGPDLSRLLTEAGVTVFSTVPTQLSMMQDDVPTLRVLVLGGERCPQDLVRRWWRPGRRMFNTYGPTESTVIATHCECDPGKPVTIGKPIPNYRAYLLDSRMQPLPAGVVGEIHVGGIGLSRGYVGKPELTAERFVADPFSSDPDARLYKTGDLARYTPDGDIEFVGRIDDQVKIRSFRVELPEIETLLRELPGVADAAVALREDVPGIQRLVGYLVPRNGKLMDDDDIKALLRAKLPSFMVPQSFERLGELPSLPSGKVDRKRLPAPTQKRTSKDSSSQPNTEFETRVAGAYERIFRLSPVSIDDDFFLDLGGHSLLAATMVSELRSDPSFSDLSMIDVYNYPTVRRLASEFEARRKTRPAHIPVNEAQATNSRNSAFFLAGLAQIVGLYFVMGFFSVEWIGPYLTYAWMIEHGHSIVASVAVALAVILGLSPLMLLAAVGVKWVVLGRIKPGNYPLWGFYYLRWWLVNRILSVIQVDGLEGTPLYNIILRLMGANIGSNVYIGSEAVGSCDLLSIGDDTSIGMGATLLGYIVENGMLRIGPITIGERCFVGAESVVRPYATMEDGASLGNLSMLPEGATIPAGESWVGSPARPLPRKNVAEEPFADRPSRAKRALFGAIYGVGILLLPVVYLAALFPGIILMNYLSTTLKGFWFIAASPPVAAIFVAVVCLEIAAVKWLLLGTVRAGRYALNSWFHARKWFVDQLMEISLEVVGPLYASLYLPPWYRMLGAKMGRNAEISTAAASTPDLLDIDDEGFIADSVFLGAPHIDRGYVTIGKTRLGKRAFIGNSALIPSGSIIGDGSLVGVLSTPPLGEPGASAPSTSWVGSPAIFLPQRQISKAFSEETTYRPTRKLYLQRLFIEFFRIILPATFFTILASLMIYAVILFHQHYSTLKLILVFPLLYTACGIGAALIVIASKWLLMGRYKPDEKPLWSTFVWKNELVTALYEHLAGPFLFHMLEGTPFMGVFLRLLGTKVGKRVYFETSEITEFDLVTIGDDVTLNSDCTVQTHLFEDRVMKMSTVSIGNGCSVGTGSVVLYDAKMEHHSTLSDLSLLMKGETLPASTRWEGTPARRAAADSPLSAAVPAGTEPSECAPQTERAAESPNTACDAFVAIDQVDLSLLAPQHEG